MGESTSYAVGIDLGATNLRVVLADKNGKFKIKLSEPTVKTGTSESLISQIIELIERSIRQANIKTEEIIGIGIGSIGPLDMKRGWLLNPPNIPFRDVPIVPRLEEHFGVPATLLNDCTTAVIGEKYFGAGKEHDNLVYITISTGIGGGAYVDGHLLLGKDGNAVEVGHTVVDAEGRLICGCGKKGHWEAYCSGTGIPKLARLILEKKGIKGPEETLILKMAKGDPSKITAKIVFEAAKKRDKLALEIVDLIGRYNAAGIANVIDAYDPSLITIGGSVALYNEELILNPIRRYVIEYAINRIPEIIITPLREDVVLYGAVALALGLERIFM